MKGGGGGAREEVGGPREGGGDGGEGGVGGGVEDTQAVALQGPSWGSAPRGSSRSGRPDAAQVGQTAFLPTQGEVLHPCGRRRIISYLPGVCT